MLEGVGDKHEPLLEPDRPGVGDALDDEVAGVLDRRQDSGIRTAGESVEGGRRPAVQGLVRPLVIVEVAAGGEGPLPQRQIGARRPDRLAFERLVHPLVRSVLLGLGREGPLVLDAQAAPPHVEPGEAVDAGGAKGHAVVGADRPRQAVLPEEPFEDRAHLLALRSEQAVASQEVAGVLVGDRQRVAVHAIAGAEVALEVGGPETIGLRGGRRHDPGVLVVAPAPPVLDQPAARARPGAWRAPNSDAAAGSSA